MKIGITTYPTLWQRTGGLQVQIHQTIANLRQEGLSVECINPLKDKLSEFDLIHIFSATHGMYLTAEEARMQGVKTVISPVFQPDLPRFVPVLHQTCDWLCRQITSNRVKTSHGYIKSALEATNHIVALSPKEEKVIRHLYKIDSRKISVIPNGIDRAFFSATPQLFDEKLRLSHGFTLVVGSISSYKNQLSVIRATKGPVVLVGQITDQNYFDLCQKEAGNRMTYLGVFDFGNPILPSIYAAAGVTVLASDGEAFGLSVAESLASGTPAILTQNNGMEVLPEPPHLQFVDSQDLNALKNAIEIALQKGAKKSEKCRAMVRHFEWGGVARELTAVYEQVLSS